MHDSVCICTFKRPALLKNPLRKLAAQQTKGLFTYSVVVSDNDPARSAEEVVRECVSNLPLSVKYCCEPEQNISLARNRAIQNAEGDFIAFIDDDEFPPEDWLSTLVETCEARRVAGVLAHVRPYSESEPPAWLFKGKFCERLEYETGYVLGWRDTRTGNVLFRREIIAGIEEPFRRALGNGGEDQDFFRRMMELGHTFIWCNEAPVLELVPAERWTRSYLLRRALLRGQNERNMTERRVWRSLVAVPLYALMLPLLVLAGHHIFMRYLVQLMDHAGKLMGRAGLKPMGGTYIDS